MTDMVTIRENCKRLSIGGMVIYLKSEIEKYPVENYKELPLCEQMHLYRLNSFLYFVKETDDKAKAIQCMNNMINFSGFADRNKIVESIKKTA